MSTFSTDTKKNPPSGDVTFQQVYPANLEQGFRTREERSCTPKRFLKAFLIAGAVYVLFSTQVHRLASLVPSKHYEWSYNIPENATLERCVDDWTPGSFLDGFEFSVAEPSSRDRESSQYGQHFESTTSFDLPISDDALWFLTRGRYMSGNVNVVTSPDQKKDTVTYKIVATYNEERLLEAAKVCKISLKSGYDASAQGVGIFLPEWISRPRWSHIEFETTIVLPESTEDSPVVIKKLITDTVQTAHHLSPKVFFETVDLRATNAPILASTLNATEGIIRSSNAPIRGVFNATNKLVISTSNAAIDVAVGLTFKKGTAGPLLIISSRNGPINGELSLLNASDSSSPGTYNATVHTSNAGVTLKFATAPLDSKLNLFAHTSNSPVSLALHPTYEGSFDLQTSRYFRADVKVDNGVEDPSGAGRERKVTFEGRTTGSSTTGQAVWGDKKEKEDQLGSVKLSTSNSAATLQL